MTSNRVFFSLRLPVFPSTASVFFLMAAACAPKVQLPAESQPTAFVDALAVVQPIERLVISDGNGMAVVGAKVMIGPKPGVPFAGNVLISEAQGIVPLPNPNPWVDAQPITVEAAGYVTTTWMGRSPQGGSASLGLAMRRKPAAQRTEFKGKATGFTNLAKDGWADVGVVFPALRRSQLASLQISDLISTEVDTITVFGQSIDIPSNVSIPKQQEKYFFTITLDKPVFRTYLNEPRTWKMVATHARFPFENVVDDLRAGKSFFDVLNYFEFKSASVNDVSLLTPSTNQDMSITDIPFAATLDVAAPKFAANFEMLAVAVADNGGMLYPTDVKTLAPGGTRRLVTAKTPGGYVVGALRDKAAPTNGAAADGLSAVIAPSNTSTRFEFLDLPPAPKVSGRTLTLSPPSSAVTFVTPATTYATLNRVDVVTSGKMQIDTKTPIWDVYAAGWSASMSLPEIAAPPAAKYRWEVLFGGAPNGSSVRLGPNMVEDLTHVTKSATDI